MEPSADAPSASSPPLDRASRALTGEFWAHVDREELVRPFCWACRRSFFTPQVVCGRCQSQDWSYLPSASRGVVYSYTVVHRAPTPAFQPPYVLAVVDVYESSDVAPDDAVDSVDVWSLLTWIVDCAPERVHIGMEVHVRFVPGPDGALLPAFAPTNTGEAAVPEVSEAAVRQAPPLKKSEAKSSILPQGEAPPSRSEQQAASGREKQSGVDQ